MKRLTILGSTGSIGTQTLDVARALPGFEIAALAAHANVKLLFEQISEFRPAAAACTDASAARELEDMLRAARIDTRIVSSNNALIDILEQKTDLVVNSLVGSAGLKPTLAAIALGIDVALANKETLVASGELVMNTAIAHNTRIFPIDSEHSAIAQCLEGYELSSVERLIITASGGPFRGYSRERLKTVSASDALKHPNWSMGPKITIDSATLMNKGLEVIEAKWLFGFALDMIDVIVHPQSIIHSMVEFRDGAVLAQLGCPDMRLPIQYALCGGKREENSFPRLNLLGKQLTFEEPDRAAFPCLDLAINASAAGGLMPTVMNAANETAVRRFLNEEISFTAIPEIIESAMNEYTKTNAARSPGYSADEVMSADAWARSYSETIKF